MPWAAYFHPKFKAEFDELSVVVQEELLASLVLRLAAERVETPGRDIPETAAWL